MTMSNSKRKKRFNRAIIIITILINLLLQTQKVDCKPRSWKRFIESKFDLGTTRISTALGNQTALPQFAIGPSKPGISGNNVGFVKAQGTFFTIDNKPFYCAGTNAYYAALKWIMSDSEVAVMFKEHANRGVTVMRVFAHSNFDSVPYPMMPSFNEYNEDAIKRLDLVLVLAAENGIRLILVLGNYWPFLGGMQQWVDRGVGKGKNMELFYTDPFLKQSYKNWVGHLLTRKNVLSGQKYSDDPTILAWELANEPRTSEKYERTRGWTPGKLVCDWVVEMSNFIKSLDPTHMVAVGDEGYKFVPNAREPYSWINNGYEGVDFECNLQAPSIDFGTIHSYPDSWDMNPQNGYFWLGDNFFRDRAAIAQRLDKPIILEEYGMRAQGYLPSREILFKYEQDQVNSANYACTLVWAVAHYSTDPGSKGSLFGKDDQGYVFAYDGDGSSSLLNQYAYMKQKSCSSWPCPQPTTPTFPVPPVNICDDIPPQGTSYSCQQQRDWGKCGESWMAGYCRQSCGGCGGSACDDIPPQGTSYSCQQQRDWGKCGESWMAGYCRQSCGGCGGSACDDIPPQGTSYSCQQQRDWGKCGESWMTGYCRQSCGKCSS